MADAARIEPTERSMPDVRMTNVMPAASTTLIEACCMTIDRFCHDAKPIRQQLKADAQQQEHRQHAERAKAKAQAAPQEVKGRHR